MIRRLASFLVIALGLAAYGCGGEPPASTEPQAETTAPAPPDFSNYPPSEVEMTLRQISDHAYYVRGASVAATGNEGFASNAGVVITDEGVVLFDALGTPSLAVKLYEQVRSLTDQPIVKVVVSHYHADHVYGLQVFEDMGAEIIAAAGAELYIDSGAAATRLDERRTSLWPFVNEHTRVVRPTTYVDEEMRFSLGGVDFLLTSLGAAHSDADLTMVVEPDRVLYSGDIIFEGRVPFAASANSKAWLETLERLETDSLAALVPGHGPTASRPNEAINLTRRYLAYLRETMGAAVDNLQSFEEAYAAADWSEFSQLPTFEQTNRRNAYQVFLAIEAEAFQ
jgi:glyoxylase-like metal-dependent hydrolase (beta-lactamase superfamily II)